MKKTHLFALSTLALLTTASAQACPQQLAGFYQTSPGLYDTETRLKQKLNWLHHHNPNHTRTNSVSLFNEYEGNTLPLTGLVAAPEVNLTLLDGEADYLPNGTHVMVLAIDELARNPRPLVLASRPDGTTAQGHMTLAQLALVMAPNGWALSTTVHNRLRDLQDILVQADGSTRPRYPKPAEVPATSPLVAVLASGDEDEE